MPGGFDFGIDFEDGAVFIDQVSDPVDTLVLVAGHFLGAPGTVGLEHFVAFIAEQGVGEAVFFLEAFLSLRGIGADTNYLDAVVNK